METNVPKDETIGIDAELEMLLDTNLDDVEDLPEFADYVPNGFFKLHVEDSVFEKVEMDADKKDSSKGQIEVLVARVVYKIEEVVEIVHEEELSLIKPPINFSESFFFNKDKKKTTEIIKAKYKEIAKALPTGTSVRELVLALKGMSLMAQIKSTKSKKDKDKYFINTSNIKPL